MEAVSELCKMSLFTTVQKQLICNQMTVFKVTVSFRHKLLSPKMPKMAAVFYKLSYGCSTGGQTSINGAVKLGFKHSKQTARWL